MKRTIVLTLIAAFACIGCNVGNAPEPMNEAELKSAVEKMPPQDQINYINASPMPQAQKDKRIKEIMDKTGYTPPNTTPAGPPKTGQ
jgi:hypothetical protein